MWYAYICIYTHTMEYYSVTKKKEIFPFATTWMYLEIIILSKSDREKQVSYDIIYMWNLKIINESIHKTEQDT